MRGAVAQNRFACVLTCATMIILVLLIVFAPAAVSKAYAHSGASVEVAEAYIDKGRASNRQAGTSVLTCSLAATIHALTQCDVSCRLAVMILSRNPPALCRVLENLHDFAFPWTSMDVFVFSHNNTAAEMLGCENQVRTCDLAAQSPGNKCTSNDTNTFFLPLQEEWRTPVEADGRHTWQTGWPEEYRRMVCAGKPHPPNAAIR